MYILRDGEYKVSTPYKEGYLLITTTVGCDPNCPYCHERLCAHDWNKRCECCLDGTVNKYMVEDRICPNCGRMQRLLPDFLVPHKHYSTESIEEMIANDMKNTLKKYPDTNESTIKRFKAWWNALELYLMAVVLSLSEKLGNMYQKAVGLREMVHDAANSCNWAFPTHLVSTPG